MLGFLRTLPRAKRQPNLLLASLRHLCGAASGWPKFRRAVLANADALRAIMLERSTRTDELARRAVPLPALARLPQPLALVEAGASAGLCLLPERYGDDYRSRRIEPAAPTAGYPVFGCSASPATPLPATMPDGSEAV